MLWKEDEKATVVEVLGVKAFDYLVTNSASNENFSMTNESFENLQKKYSDIFERNWK